MRIKSLSLIEYNRLQVSRLKELHIDIEQDILLIIGSNGSGKSSILKEMYPNAPIRTIFSKQGFKGLTLTHQNSEYQLSYSPKDGHQFVRDQQQLNNGGTNEVQRELIGKHLGLDNVKHQILMCDLPICEMLPSQRKKVLMNLNPTDVSLFVDRHQKVRKDVTAYSNNLKRLYQRQKALAEQKLPIEQFEKMKERQAELIQREQTLLVWTTKVEEQLEQYRVDDDQPLTDIEYFKDNLRSLHRELGNYSHISRAHYRTRQIEAPAQIKVHRDELQTIEQQLQELIKLVDDYEEKKEKLNTEGADVDQELIEAKKQLSQYDLDPNYTPISESQLAECYQLVEKIQNVLVELTYLEYKECRSRDAHRKHYQLVVDMRAEIDQLKQEIKQVNHRRDELSKGIKKYKISEQCPQTGCELLNTYQSHLDEKRKEYESLSSKLKNHEERYQKLEQELTQETERYRIQDQAWKYIDQVNGIVQRHPEVSRLLTETKLLEYVNHSPLTASNWLRSQLELSERYHSWRKLQERVKELEQLNESVKSRQQWSTELLEGEIKRHTTQLADLREKYEVKNDKIEDLQKEYQDINGFVELTERLKELQKLSDTNEKEVERKASYQYLDKLKGVLNGILQRTREEQTELNRVVKDQEMLLSRLDQEVDQVIETLRPRYEKAQMVENALFELPINYTRTFVNDLIETANYFINEIFTYPLQLRTYGENDKCDFHLPVLIDGSVPVRDVSECSEGQKEIIQLCFCLALITQLELTDYPVYVDEVDRTLDPEHRRRLTDLLLTLVTERVIGQLFVINHSPSMIEGLSGLGDVFVLNGDNVRLPPVYNRNVKMVHY